MEKIFDGQKYTLIPIPPYVSPYSVLIGKLLEKKAESTEEAEAASTEIKKAMDKLFTVTVTPKPKVEHETQLFVTLNQLTQQVIKEAEFFHKHPGPNDPQGKPDGSPPTSEA